MDVAVKTPFLGLNPKILTHKQKAAVSIRNHFSKRESFPLQMRYNAKAVHGRAYPKNLFAVRAVASGAYTSVEDTEVWSPQPQNFLVTVSGTSEANERKLTVEVSGARTRAIFDDVFSKMVADAQPIPGFRRVKGGKTPDIPMDILLQVLGPSKVYKEVIQKVISCTIADYVEEEGLRVSKDLRVEQSIEDLEAAFEPGDPFGFEAVVQLQESN